MAQFEELFVRQQRTMGPLTPYQCAVAIACDADYSYSYAGRHQTLLSLVDRLSNDEFQVVVDVLKETIGGYINTPK